MKLSKKFILLLTLVFSISLFAQRSTYFEGTYEMEYGNQTMKITHEGGSAYKAFFSGECNAHTVEGSAEYGNLEIPIVGGRSRDMIIIEQRGNKLDVSVTDENIMRNSCNGYSIVGLYKKKNNSYNNNHYSGYNENYNHKKYNNDNFNNSYHSRDSRNYNSHADVHDLMGVSATLAYDKLKTRGFYQVKEFQSKAGKTYRVWYNNETNQCIKTISINKHIHDVLKSTHCNN